MFKVPALALVAVASLAGPTAVAAPSIWTLWARALDASCPERHIEWEPEGAYLALLESFEATLPIQTRKHIRTIADLPRACADEGFGFSCEMSVSMTAYRHLGLLKQFAILSCRHNRCEETAICSDVS